MFVFQARLLDNNSKLGLGIGLEIRVWIGCGHGCVAPQGEDPLVSRPSLLPWLAASALESAGEREWHLSIYSSLS